MVVNTVEEYENYHKHDRISNIFTPDTHIFTIDYINRIKELGYGCYFTTNHGSGGDIFESLTLCRQNGIKCLFGIEGYIVPNPLEKDKRNYHIVIIPRDNIARKKLNLINSRANAEGFYYKPRIFLEDLLKLNPNEVYITTACVAGIVRDIDAVRDIFIPLMQHFGKNLFLEVQNHNERNQKLVNQICLKLSEKYGLSLIAANDSHYIYPEQAKDRLEFLKGKGINYGDEDSYILDFPDYNTFYQRFIKQGVLSPEQIKTAIANTLIFRDCEEIDVDYSIKMPSVYPNLTADEKITELKSHVVKKFKEIIKTDKITSEEIPMYKQGIYEEMKVIEQTKEINTADYFLFNEKLVDKAINEYHGVLTRTGRGSCGAFYINKILGMTQLDRFRLDIKLYPERFMSTARLLENRALPDIDFNVVSQEPFIKAAKDLLGEHGCYPMIAYGTMQMGEAFRNVCRTHGLNYDEYNEIAKNVEDYADNKKWKPYIDEAQKYIDVVVSASPHPCAYLLDNKDLRSEYGVVRVGDKLCVMITSSEADEYKMLKDDFLVVTVYKLIDETFKLIGKPIITVRELLSSVKDDERIWDIFAKGLTCTLNQVDGDWATSLLKEYKPKNYSDMSMFVACLRPFFNAWRDGFIAREDFTTGSPYLDEVLSSTNGYILFQENLMQYFEWLGVTPAESIGLIKKISKKKIKPEDFTKLEERIRAKWLENTGSMEAFDTTWEMIQGCMSYGFCISGDSRIYKSGRNEKYEPTVKEMYHIMNDRQYAVKTNHVALYKKYRSYGYGKALSMYDDCKVYENSIVDIKFTGIRQTYQVTTKSGKSIICTNNHSFPTPNGKKQLMELKVGDELYCLGGYQKDDYRSNLTNGVFKKNYPQKGQQGFQHILNGNSVVYDRERLNHVENEDNCELCGCSYSKEKLFELHHKDHDRTNNDPLNYMWLCNSCHKRIHYQNGRNTRYKRGLNTYLDEIVSILPHKKEEVYSVEMASPAHTFLSENGLVTSNCSAHAVATAIDCLYGAYLKVHYPLEYYTVALTNYSGDMERTNKLMKELPHFGITLYPIKFGKSSAQYAMDKENNAIYKGIESIKFCNAIIAQELLELSKNHYENFIELLDDIKDKTSVNSRQLKILTGLNFFSDFGNNQYLLNIIDLYDGIKITPTGAKSPKTILPPIRTCKQFKKDKLETYREYGIAENLIKKYSEKETAKQYSQIDNLGLLTELCKTMPNEQMSIKDYVRFEKENLDYVTYVNPDMADDYYIVTDFKVYKNATKPVLVIRNIKTGEDTEISIQQSKIFKQNPFGCYAILKIQGFTWVYKRKEVNGKWVATDTLIPVLEEYEVM